MKIVILKFTNDDARYILYLLRKRYGKDGHTGLSKLCKTVVLARVAALARQDRAIIRRLCDLATRTEDTAQAREDLVAAEKAYEDESKATRQDDEERTTRTEQEDYVFIIRSGTGYLARFTEGDLLLVTAEPVGATRVKRSMADSLMSRMAQLGFEAELLKIKFSLAKNKVYYEPVKD